MDDLEKLQEQIADLQRQAEELLKKKRSEVIEEVRTKIRVYNITPKDLGISDKHPGKMTAHVPTKYRLGNDSWTGRGRQPKFILDHLAQGGSLEDLLVR